jgi:hypothetical protein
MTPDTLAPVPPRCAVAPAGLSACPQCGVWQGWLGLVQSHYAQCGWSEASMSAAPRGAGARSIAPSLVSGVTHPLRRRWWHGKA